MLWFLLDFTILGPPPGLVVAQFLRHAFLDQSFKHGTEKTRWNFGRFFAQIHLKFDRQNFQNGKSTKLTSETIFGDAFLATGAILVDFLVLFWFGLGVYFGSCFLLWRWFVALLVLVACSFV